MWAAALAIGAFVLKVLMHVTLWFRRTGQGACPQAGSPVHGGIFNWRACLALLPEIFFMRRLYKANPAVWLGEWVFHASFILVLIRHLKYFLTPVPAFVWRMQGVGGIASYAMPLSLLYIIILKAIVNRGKYLFAYNYFLLTAFILVSSIGVMMRTFFYPDPLAVKQFITGALGLKAAAAPESLPFIIHFSLFLIILPFLPTHIITAPFTLYQAGKREKGLKVIIHD